MFSVQKLTDFLGATVTPGEPVPEGYVYLSGQTPFAHLHLLADRFAFFWAGTVEIDRLAGCPSQMERAAITSIMEAGVPPPQWSPRMTLSLGGQLAELRQDRSGNRGLFAIWEPGTRLTDQAAADSSPLDMISLEETKLKPALERLPDLFAAHFFLESQRRTLQLWATTQAAIEFPEVGVGGNVPISSFALQLFSETCSFIDLRDDPNVKQRLLNDLQHYTPRYINL